MGKIFLAEKLHSALDEKFQTVIESISDCAEKFNKKAYIIGGVVRDLFLEKPIYDIDIVIEGDAIEFCRWAEQENYWKIKRIAKDFGTVKIIFKNNLEVDIASTRTESYPKAGHLPIVKKLGCTLKEDILRRDFTVNALALSLNKENFGEVIDYTDGLGDLKNKQLKILHEKSFIDDPTRIIRALRFKHKLGFEIEPNTKKLMQAYLKDFNENDICYERIKQVTRLAFNLNSYKLFEEFIDQKIYKLLGCEIRNCKGKNVADATEKNISQINPNNLWLIYLACLLTPEKAEKLNLSAKENDILVWTEKLLSKKTRFKSNFDIYKFFKTAPKESIIAYLALTGSEEAQKYLDKLQNIKLSINGKTLMKLGYKEGKLIGETLDKILEAKINGLVSTKQEQLELAKKLLK